MQSGASHEEQESDGDLFGSEQDESEDEDSEGQEKKKAKPKVGATKMLLGILTFIRYPSNNLKTVFLSGYFTMFN